MKQPKRWSRLDNAAKIFPPTSSRRDPRVYRVACELNEEPNPEILQFALDRTLELFPFYNCVLKRGLFWYYFEDSELKSTVREESEPPCSPMIRGNRKKLLFQVTYYRRRINLEVYHALSDGTGAIQFFRTLLLFYFKEMYGDEPGMNDASIDYDAPATERDDDSFQKYFSKEKLPYRRVRVPKAYKIRGEMLPPGGMCVIEGLLSSAKIKAAAKQHGATITEYLTAVLVLSIGEGMTLGERRRPVGISVPVNLRQYFPSDSARNFFGTAVITCKLGETLVFNDILADVKASFEQSITQEKMRRRMNAFTSLEHNPAMKLIPLVLKNPIITIAARVAGRRVTAGLSNVSRIALPEPLHKHIRLLDAFNSTPHMQILLLSFNDSFIVSFTSIFEATDIQRRFFRHLTALGMECEISTNWLDPREMSPKEATHVL